VSDLGERPWLARYEAGQPTSLTPEFGSALEMFQATVARAPDAALVRYFDTTLRVGEVDRLSDALACALLDRDVQPGDRVALYLQNVPQFVVGLLATWKVGAIAVSINPMLKTRELRGQLLDSGAVALLCLESLYRDVAAEVVGDTAVHTTITTSELEFQAGDDPRAFAGSERIACDGALDLADLLERFAGQQPPAVDLSPDSIAFLTYTSGTTGPPKGAQNTHANVVFNAQAYRQWCGLDGDTVVLGVAPLFHITGLIAHVAISLLLGAPLVLFHRFEPSLAVEVIRDQRPTFTVGSITVFIALMNAPGVRREDLASLERIWSGGAPIPPSTVRAFEEQFGHYIHNIYGLTETTSPSHAVPFGATAPVDPTSGALSVGVPIFDTVVRVVGDDGQELPTGEVGEFVTSGPQVVSGYWGKPEETAHAIPDGHLHTGDVGYVDADGWFYVVDRKKDQINAGGYKVWPREVEDVLYEHDAVREAAVVGVPDEYRGESVKAFVSLKPGSEVAVDELVAFAKDRMAAYKYPREIEILEELPKTATGKLLRRELRARELDR
jgi:long-chain acyl-CoA synthetase